MSHSQRCRLTGNCLCRHSQRHVRPMLQACQVIAQRRLVAPMNDEAGDWLQIQRLPRGPGSARSGS